MVKPRICEILGVEVEERFKVQTTDGSVPLNSTFHITDIGYLVNENESVVSNIGIDLINGYFELIKIPKYNTDEQKEIFKALKTLGYNYIARDSDYDINVFELEPEKCRYDWHLNGGKYIKLETDKILNAPHLDFIDWEDDKPFEIPEVE